MATHPNKMPMLHNNQTARGSNPFKQVHVNKQLHNESTLSKLGNRSPAATAYKPRHSSSSRNPPGLTAMKFNYQSP